MSIESRAFHNNHRVKFLASSTKGLNIDMSARYSGDLR